MAVLGFFGMAMAASPKTRVGAWALFQLGWLLAILLLEPQGGAVTFTVAWVFGFVSLTVLGVLWALSRRIPAPEAVSKGPARKGAK